MTQRTGNDAHISTAPVKGPRIRATASRSRFPRLFEKKERWGLSWWGWVAVVSVLLIVGYVILLNAYPFLAVTDRTDATILVIEGWIHPFGISTGVDEFMTCHY